MSARWRRSGVGSRGLVQLRFAEAEVGDDRECGERDGQEVGQPGAGEPGDPAAEQRAGDQRDSLDEPDPADALLERVAVAGLLQHRVVDDGVHRPGVHGEVDAEDQRAEDVAGHVVAHPADQRTHRQRDAGHDQHPAAAPPVGEDPGRYFDDRHDRGVGGGHHADRGGVEADLGHEQLLDRRPEHETLQERGDVQWQQPTLQRGPGSDVSQQRGHDDLLGGGLVRQFGTGAFSGTSGRLFRSRHGEPTPWGERLGS